MTLFRFFIAMGNAERTERDALIEFDVIADDGGLSDHGARAVIDEEASPDLCSRVDVDSGAGVGMFGDDARNHRHARAMEPMRDAICSHGFDGWIAEYDFFDVLGGRIALVCSAHIAVQHGAKGGQLSKESEDDLFAGIRGRCAPRSTHPAVVGQRALDLFDQEPIGGVKVPCDGLPEIVAVERTGAVKAYEDRGAQMIDRLDDAALVRKCCALERVDFERTGIACSDRVDGGFEFSVPLGLSSHLRHVRAKLPAGEGSGEPTMSRILELVGSTPLVELETGVARPSVKLYGKLEGNNPGGSVKDRPARSMILRAEERGELRPGMRIVEPTSGNTGIALAMIAAARGYPLELVMPSNATAERVRQMRALGATVTLTPAEGGMEGAIDAARAKIGEGGVLMLDQFANPDNWHAHYESTGPEIWRDTGGTITHFVSAMGTTGTIMGVSRYLKEQRASITIAGCQPTENSSIPGIRRWPAAYLPKIYEPERVDRIIDVDQRDAEETTRRLARSEGVFVGASSGGAVWAARKVCSELAAKEEDGVVVCILCDRGDRYLSSALFDAEGTR